LNNFEFVGDSENEESLIGGIDKPSTATSVGVSPLEAEAGNEE